MDEKKLEILKELWEVIQDRKSNPSEGSYTVKLIQDPDKLMQKMDEELDEIKAAVEAGATTGSGKDSLVWETGDLLYHLLVLLASKDVDFEHVLDELRRRRSA